MGREDDVTGRSRSWLGELAAGSTMGELVAAFDWASSPLGPAEHWSADLRAAVRMCLSTRFPVLVVCGPEMIKIYNDGYRLMLGEKHPGALGTPAGIVWREAWDLIGPLFAQVYETGEATWNQDMRLVVERNGFPEECYFTFSYSPVLDDDGRVNGVVDIATETTETVVGRERLSCVTDLTSTLVEAEGITDVCLETTAALSRWREAVAAADVYLRIDDQLVLVASNRRGQHPAVDATIADGRSVIDVLGRQPVTDRPVDDITVPVGGSVDGAVGALVLSLNPRRPYDAGHAQFIELVARAVGAALDRAHRHAVEVDEYRQIGDTLQRAMLEPASNFRTVAARYLPATGNLAVGGDWYDVIDLDHGRRGLVVGDCVGHGLDAATAMSQLRSAARAMLLQGSDPAETLRGLDLFARSIDAAFCTTAICMVVEPGDGVLVYARAGHPYPLVVGADGVTWLDDGGGPPLGFADAPGYENVVQPFTGNDLVVLYSDGLIERRGEDIGAGFERLAAAATSLRDQTVEVAADDLIAALLPTVPADDVVLVVKRLPELAARRDA